MVPCTPGAAFGRLSVVAVQLTFLLLSVAALLLAVATLLFALLLSVGPAWLGLG